jgi:hypothetical protein
MGSKPPGRLETSQGRVDVAFVLTRTMPPKRQFVTSEVVHVQLIVDCGLCSIWLCNKSEPSFNLGAPVHSSLSNPPGPFNRQMARLHGAAAP